MRRESDIKEGARTGVGRRARDRILSGDAMPLPRAVPLACRSRVGHRMEFVADELRESALAAAGIEAFLVEVHRSLDREDVTADELARLLDRCDIDRRIAALDDALYGLRRSLQSMIDASTLDASSA